MSDPNLALCLFCLQNPQRRSFGKSRAWEIGALEQSSCRNVCCCCWHTHPHPTVNQGHPVIPILGTMLPERHPGTPHHDHHDHYEVSQGHHLIIIIMIIMRIIVMIVMKILIIEDSVVSLGDVPGAGYRVFVYIVCRIPCLRRPRGGPKRPSLRVDISVTKARPIAICSRTNIYLTSFFSELPD